MPTQKTQQKHSPSHGGGRSSQRGNQGQWRMESRNASGSNNRERDEDDQENKGYSRHRRYEEYSDADW